MGMCDAVREATNCNPMEESDAGAPFIAAFASAAALATAFARRSRSMAAATAMTLRRSGSVRSESPKAVDSMDSTDTSRRESRSRLAMARCLADMRRASEGSRDEPHGLGGRVDAPLDGRVSGALEGRARDILMKDERKKSHAFGPTQRYV